ncbi:MAG: putative baseplate assembly protein [Ginsengibacter sp.]
MAEVNSCNCCEGVSVETPVDINNRPGLNAIAYRVGTHAQFKESLLARISLSGQPALENFTTRENNDFSIALLDAWAVVADVLTFYQERIANESYLRTATERFSILEMARLIGYELRPGVAAAAYLSFILEDTPAPLGPIDITNKSAIIKEGLPPINIAKGTKVQSIPGPDEKPQTFETFENIEARAEWNAIKPRLTQPLVSADAGLLIFKGISLNLKEGDILLTGTPGSFKLKKIFKVTIDTEAKTTWVYLNLTATPPTYSRPINVPEGNTNDFSTANELSETVVTDIISKTWKEEDIAMLIESKKWSAFELLSSMNKIIQAQSAEVTGNIYVFRKRAFVFGYNAPQHITFPGNVPTFSEWPSDKEQPGKIFLDSAYEEILPGSFIAVQKAADMNTNSPDVYKINGADVRIRSEYQISTKTTEISFSAKSADDKWWTVTSAANFSDVRPVVIHAQTELLPLEQFPITDVVEGNSMTLNRYYPGLTVGQKLILTGDRSNLKGVSASEVLELKELIVEKGFTVLVFLESLKNTYVRSSVNISANVALATNGESAEEVLGSGDAGQSFQKFTLRQPPLTYVSGSSSTGTVSTLEVRVNDILWHEADNFLYHLPEERIYITRRDNEGKTNVIFGDGITGSRLPSGQENIRAKYRKGIGLGGLVKANQLSQLITRPLGVKSAINPLGASGAADPEQLDEARRNAPLGILTLGRVVSLQDYEDFSRAFAGIDKALATWSWVEQKRHIFITIAGANGEEVKKESLLYDNLLKALRNEGDPIVALTLESYLPKFFRLSAKVQTDPDYIGEKVLEEVEQKLRDTFSFSRRQFGQSITYGEVVSVIQQVKGVIAVDVDKLYRSDQPEDLKFSLQASVPATGDENVLAAELLTLDQRPVDLKIMT